MKLKYLFGCILAFIFCNINICAQTEKDDNKVITNKNKPERAEWLRDLGFGMFLHFSLDSQLGTVISHSMVGASDDYNNRFLKELPKTFDPYLFDGYRLAVKAKLAGARYICLTAKHHSGFCLWDTNTTDYKITNTPYGKDLFKEYVDGARKAGLAVGVYFSPEDFKFLYDNGVLVKRGKVNLSQSLKEKYEDLIRAQTRELFTMYGKIDMLFIDGNPKKPCLEEAWKIQPDVVITRGAVNTPEQTLPGTASDILWESCVTMGTQWQYKPTNDNLKNSTRLIELLVETRAKGGNFLLNVGPTPDGVYPDPEYRNMTEMAAWTFINHEAIYGVRPWIITNEDNIWFTASKDRKTVYAVITGINDWKFGERKKFIIGSIKAEPDFKISVLGQNSKVVEYADGADASCKYEQHDDGLHVSVVRAQRVYNNYKWPNPIVIKLENVVPAIVPSLFTTGKIIHENGSYVSGEIFSLGNAPNLEISYEWRPAAGFTENLYVTQWHKADSSVVIDNKGKIKLSVPEKMKGHRCDYRLLVKHGSILLRSNIMTDSF